MVKNTFTCSDGETFTDKKLAEDHEDVIEQDHKNYVRLVNNGMYIVSIANNGVFIEDPEPYDSNIVVHTIILSGDMGKKLGAIEEYFNVSVK